MEDDSRRPVRLAGVAPPASGAAIRVEVAGRPVAVFNVGGQLLAIDARCPHVGGPLERGRVTGSTVDCPLHGSRFDLATGEVRRGPATVGVRAYAVRVDGDSLVLEPR